MVIRTFDEVFPERNVMCISCREVYLSGTTHDCQLVTGQAVHEGQQTIQRFPWEGPPTDELWVVKCEQHGVKIAQNKEDQERYAEAARACREYHETPIEALEHNLWHSLIDGTDCWVEGWCCEVYGTDEGKLGT